MTQSNDSLVITVRELPIIAEIAEIDGIEIRLNLKETKPHFAVVTEAGGVVAVQAVFDNRANAEEAAEALEHMLRRAEAPRLATIDGRAIE